MGFLRKALRKISGGEETPPPEQSSAPSVAGLSAEELEKIGTEEDLLRDYEAAVERNFEATEAESKGDVERAIELYERNVAEEFVEGYPYERLASLYERRGVYGEALRVTESFIRLAESGRMPRGAQASADRRLPSFKDRAERYRKLLNDTG